MLSQEKCSVLFDEIDFSSQRVRSNMNKTFFFYIVHNIEITGRYDGANLIDALSRSFATVRQNDHSFLLSERWYDS